MAFPHPAPSRPGGSAPGPPNRGLRLRAPERPVGDDRPMTYTAVPTAHHEEPGDHDRRT